VSNIELPTSGKAGKITVGEKCGRAESFWSLNRRSRGNNTLIQLVYFRQQAFDS